MTELTQFGTSLAIAAGQTQAIYQEDTQVIPAGGYVDVFKVFNYFRVISKTGGTLSVQFGQNGLQTPFTGAGVGLQLFTQVDRVRLVNTHPTDAMTITIAVALGWINDDRLTVSGTVTIAGAVTITSGNVTSQTKALASCTTAQVALSTTAAQLVAAGASNGLITVQAGAVDMYIGNSNAVTTSTGFLVASGGSFTYPIGYTGDVYAILAASTATAYVMTGSY